jgi:tryptophan synthase alpha chain
MAGDPDLRMTESLATACEAGGADVLELGIPFSDPIADGPDIQEAGQRALLAGTRPRDVVELAARVRLKTEIPLVLMTYMNPVLAMGLPTFAERAASAGVDGVIVPDLSLEASSEIRDALEPVGIDLIQLVAPSTPPARAAAIADASRGFLYVVARYGTTGVQSNLPEDLSDRIVDLHRLSSLPLGVGFGVTTGAHVRAVAAAGADGVVVGSSIVSRAAECRDADEVRKFVAELAAGLAVERTTSPVLGRNDR